MSKKKYLFYLLSLPILLFSGAFSSVGANNPVWVSSEKPDAVIIVKPEASYDKEGGHCYIYPYYTVITEDKPGSVGSDIYVFARTQADRDLPAHCNFSKDNALVVKKNVWAEYFAGIYKDYFFVDSGTGTRRNLSLYSIAKKSEEKWFLSYDGTSSRFRIEHDNLINTDHHLSEQEVLHTLSKVPVCPPRVPEQTEAKGYHEEIRGTYMLNLKDWSKKITDVKCEIVYEE